MKPGQRRLLIPGLLVALLVIVVIAAVMRRADADATPTPVPVVAHTQVSTMDDPRISESSGLAASLVHPGIVYTVNDSGHAPQVFAVDVASGHTVGVTTVEGVHWRDTEAMAVWDGKVWVADVGDNDWNRHDIALYAFDEPGAGNHRVTATRYPVSLDSGPANVESMSIVPGRIDLYAKGWPVGPDLALIGPLRTDAPNIAHRTGRSIMGIATDAAATPDGRYVLARNVAVVEVRDAKTWQLLHRDAIPVMAGGETITVEPSGRSYLVGSEGIDSPLVRVPFQPSSWGKGPIPDIDPQVQGRAQHPVSTFLWRHRLLLAGGTALFTIVMLVGVVAWLRRRRAASRGR